MMSTGSSVPSLPVQARLDELAKRAEKTIKEILNFLGIVPQKIETGEETEQLVLNIVVLEEESGLLIGYHGETLGALQYLVGQIVNHGRESWLRVIVNINGYRNQRELQLKQMAENAADRAVTTGNEIEMPYLTPAERRIIHLELVGRADVTSFSEGEGRTRRLIIAPKPATPKA